VAGRADHCVLCGELLDIGSSICRVCGENNDPMALDRRSEFVEIPSSVDLDQLGAWSQAKHDILEKYATAYTTILTQQKHVRRVIYIDAFAGAGVAEDRDTGSLIEGSATRAAAVTPPFDELHFVELDSDKAAVLSETMQLDSRVRVHNGDAETILRRDILPRCRFEDYARALCVLDPYGLSVNWALLETIGKMRSVEIFFNFMVMGANRNVLWTDPTKVSPSRLRLMDRVWGDRTWQDAAYRNKEDDLFGGLEKVSNEELVEAFRQRLQTVAGFKYVPKPVAMKNTRRATVYYLFFASPNATANKIVTSIFSKYRSHVL
jgi:three-Cys-motif partner protein